jgi:uncharacterized protein
LLVSRLWIYPIKSCGGIPVAQLTLDDRGPLLDRRWMLVDAHNDFMTQREHPRMTLIEVASDGDQIRLRAPGMPDHAFQRDAGADRAQCVVWNSTVELLHVGADSDAWFSEYLKFECRLMRMPAATERVVNPAYSPARRLVTLADGYPMLVITTGSLQLLNEKLRARGEAEVTMERFRPNIEVVAETAHVEDGWRTITIGDLACDIVKPCERCAITTVDLRTGELGKEPLRTLSEYRKVGSKVLFGQNVIHQREGSIRVGDGVSVVV